MAHWICENCGSSFKRDKSGSRPIRFCCAPCYHEWSKKHGDNVGRFKPKQKPWNKDVKGLQLSPKTQFKKGQESARKMPVGAVTIRHRNREKHPRAFVKIGNPSVWVERAKYVWEQHYGPVANGYVIHHKDRNPLNDSIENLQVMTRAEHINEHRNDLEPAPKPVQEPLL